jgi:hypothetical protein
MRNPGIARRLAAALLAALAATSPGWAALQSCPDARPDPAAGGRACCALTSGEACCCAGKPAAQPGRDARVEPPRCDCSLAPAAPERSARPAEAAAEAGRGLRARFAALVQALAPAPPAPVSAPAPCAGREPPGRGPAPPASLARGGPARLHLLAVARL